MRLIKTRSKILWWFVLFLLVWVAGCGVPTGTTPTIPSTLQPMPTATEQPSATPTHPALSPTSILPTTTQTPTNSMTPTVVLASPTPLPTLSADQAQSLVLDLLQTNGGCKLPCWWGITPGETRTQETRSFLEKFGSLVIGSIHDEKGGYIQIQAPENELIVWPRVEYEANADDHTVELLSVLIEIVRKIEDGYEVVYEDPLFEQLMPQYTLPQILSAYGQPSEVLVRGIRGWWEFDLLLFYSESGFLINYSAPYEEENGVYFGCPNKASIELWLWELGRYYSLPEAATMIFGKAFGRQWLESYLPLKDATSLSPEAFYETYKEPQTITCLETSIDLWPEP
jgi:hypothetical protein